MAFSFINDPTDLDSNSYCSVEEANDYHETVHPSLKAQWTALTTAQKERALVSATRALDDAVSWMQPSYISNSSQTLQFPRKYLPKQGKNYAGYSWGDDQSVSYFASNVYPEFLQNATAELARFLFGSTTSPTVPKQQNSAEKVKAGSVEVVLRSTDTTASSGPIPASVFDMVARWGDVATPALVQGQKFAKNIPVERG